MTESKGIVLVTGASGFVGRHLAPALVRAGWSVRPAVRSPQGLDGEVVVDSIGPDTAWEAALDGVDAVVHLAARVHHPNEEHAVELYRNVNTAGTLHLARSAIAAGVRRFIFLSTALVHGASNEGRAPFSEEDTLTPRGVYGMSKATAEAGLRTLAQGSDMYVSVIRPPLVYGAGAKGNFAQLARVVNLGLPLPLAAIRNRRAFLAVQNLSSFVLHRLALPDPASSFEIFLVADNEQVSTPELVERLARASGKSPRLFGVSPELLRWLLGLVGRQDTYHSLIASLELNISKAIATGWQPEVTLDEGLRLALVAQDP